MPSQNQILKHSMNLAVLIAIVYLGIWGLAERAQWTWQPFAIFALLNWIFADKFFQHIPSTLQFKHRPLRLSVVADIIIAILLAILAYSFLSRYLFDDAGFVLRYVENFKSGYFYRFNPTDAPVFGLSGFIYGLVCFFFSIFGLPSPVCLKLANLLGTMAYIFILLQICRHLIRDKRMVWLVFISLCLGVEAVVLMFAAGLELPVHIAIVMATIFFRLKNQPKWFLVFAALSIMSKLDTVPIVAVLFIFYIWEQVILLRSFKNLTKIFIYTGIPLGIWILFTLFWFGSPLPQSAYAKYIYHVSADQHAFPFLFHFLEHPVRKISFLLLEGLAVLHLIDIIYYRKLEKIKLFIWGWMLIAILTLYYFYNPSERMLWYYSLPDFFMLAQVLFSLVYFTSKKFFREFILLTALPVLFYMVSVMQNSNNALIYHNFYTERVERERYRIGDYMGEISNPGDTLMSRHGLVGWRFKGYVIDLSGLNSKLVTRYKRNTDSLINDFRPHYIIDHCWIDQLNNYGKHGFEIKEIFADVNLLDYPAWAVMKRTEKGKRSYIKLEANNCQHTYEMAAESQVLHFHSDSLYLTLPQVPVQMNKLWTGIKREEEPYSVNITLYNDSLIIYQSNIKVEKTSNEFTSKYVKGIEIPLIAAATQADAISIKPVGRYSFTLFGPFIELQW
jgi:hypothetical protein